MHTTPRNTEIAAEVAVFPDEKPGMLAPSIAALILYHAGGLSDGLELHASISQAHASFCVLDVTVAEQSLLAMDAGHLSNLSKESFPFTILFFSDFS